MRDRIIARIRSNRLASLVVRLTNKRRGRLIDLRFYDDPRHVRGFGATSVGISIRPDLLRSVIEALEKAEAAAIKEGLIKCAPDNMRPVVELMPPRRDSAAGKPL